MPVYINGVEQYAAHALGSASHVADTIANLNTKVTDRVLDGTVDTRSPTAHALGGASHSADTLANLNTKISDGPVDVATASRLLSQRTTATRDMTAASGNVAYTGYGFTPKALVCPACVSDAKSASVMISDSIMGNSGIVYRSTDDYWKPESSGIVKLGADAGNQQLATIASYDADGWTATWAKTGNPTGTGWFYALALR